MIAITLMGLMFSFAGFATKPVENTSKVDKISVSLEELAVEIKTQYPSNQTESVHTRIDCWFGEGWALCRNPDGSWWYFEY